MQRSTGYKPEISMSKGDYETSGTKMPKNDATITRKKDDEVSAT